MRGIFVEEEKKRVGEQMPRQLRMYTNYLRVVYRIRVIDQRLDELCEVYYGGIV